MTFSAHYDFNTGLSQLRRAVSRDGTARADQDEQTFTAVGRAGATTDEHAPELATWSGGPVGDLIVEHITALHVTQFTITNPHSAEFAARVDDGTRGERWRLSWLPERMLNRKQVFSAMVLDEILIAHELDSGTMLQVMSALAADLAMPLHQILGRLSFIKMEDTEPRGIADRQPRAQRYRGAG
jgi:hypothetical protein